MHCSEYKAGSLCLFSFYSLIKHEKKKKEKETSTLNYPRADTDSCFSWKCKFYIDHLFITGISLYV